MILIQDSVVVSAMLSHCDSVAYTPYGGQISASIVVKGVTSMLAKYDSARKSSLHR